MKDLLYIGIIVILGIVLFFSLSEIKDKNNQNEILNDNLIALESKVKETTNKLKEKSFKNKALYSTNTDLIANIKTKDKDLKRLQKLVKKYKKDLEDKGGSVTVFTDTNIINKTVIVDTNSFIYKDNWINLSGTINDSLTFNLSTVNKYSIVIGREKTGWFKSKPYVEVTNQNPYSRVTSLKTYKVEQNEKKFNFGISAGYGIIFNNGIKTGPGVNVGINYNF